jgi:hypothetical protein
MTSEAQHGDARNLIQIAAPYIMQGDTTKLAIFIQLGF